MPSFEKRLYQLIISRLDGERLSSSSYRDRAFELVRKGLGGFILFGGEKDEVKSFIGELRADAEIPLFIASDIERGVGQQIKGAVRFPCQMAVAAAIDKNNADDVTLLEDVIHAIAGEARDIGINMPLIPVLDVNRNPENPIICTRAFSDDPGEVAWYGKFYIKKLEEAGLISCAKHFPGHGDTSIDSHLELPVISKPLSELNAVDILPFKEGVRAGVSSVMLGHLGIPAIDTLPASLSKKMVTDLLRKELGFQGLVLTDALNMHALKGMNKVATKCMNAGVDVLLHPDDADAAVEELKAAVGAGEVKEEAIDTAVERILKYKAKLKGIQKAEINYNEHAGLSVKIFDKSVTVVKDPRGALPVKDTQDARLVLIGEEDAPVLKKFCPELDSKFNPESSSGQNSKLNTLIFAVFTNVAAWSGTSGIREEDVRSIKELMKAARLSVVISFGSPYVLSHFPEADALIAAYDTTEQAQLSVIKCLKGEKDFKGRLPVRVKS
ncbi:MAG: hypothetical protein HZA14_02920 [Nitrospirae bacterium]|nr:hypothetical protein [Nitrospirota bacterium]